MPVSGVIAKVPAAARRHPVISGILTVVAVAIVATKALAYGSEKANVDFSEYERGNPGRHLVVLVHAYTGSVEKMATVRRVAEQAYPNADFLLPAYSARLLSNADPLRIVDQIEEKIQELDNRHQYDRITLVGYSLGSLLVRKAYVWGVGGELSADRLGGRSGRHAWVDKVDRIVLLAGMNRGWTTEVRPDDPTGPRVKASTRFVFGVARWYGGLTGTGRLIRSFEAGAPFVANLRVQWIRLARRAPQSDSVTAPTIPAVIQLLGKDDDLVSEQDSRDAAASKDFVFIPVTGTGHGDMTRFPAESASSNATDAENQRRAKVTSAIADPISMLRERYPNTPSTERPDVEHVVFIMHGIRDYGDWMARLDSAIKRRAGDKPPEVIRSSYGYFPMSRFLVFGARQKNVRWFMDQYTTAVATYPHAKISYVGHSNGTYLLASALGTYQAVKVHRILFAGSVVRRNFNWGQYTAAPPESRQVDDIRNVVAASDWVVGIFPRFFEFLASMTPFLRLTYLDIGSAGFRGFQEDGVNVRFVPGQHSAALATEDRIDAIASYIATGDLTAMAPFRKLNAPSVIADWASKLSWIIWLLLVFIIWRVGKWAAPKIGHRASRLFARGAAGRAWTEHLDPRIGGLAYTAVVLLLLYSV